MVYPQWFTPYLLDELGVWIHQAKTYEITLSP